VNARLSLVQCAAAAAARAAADAGRGGGGGVGGGGSNETKGTEPAWKMSEQSLVA
jgi:hypothetical protein